GLLLAVFFRFFPVSAGGREGSGGGRAGGGFLGGGAQLRLEVLVDPLLIEPLERIDELAVEQHAEVQVIAAGEARGARAPDDLAARDRAPLLDANLVEVPVQ